MSQNNDASKRHNVGQTVIRNVFHSLTDVTNGQIISPYISRKLSTMVHTHIRFYLMCVAGRDSNCLERKSSLCLSWCFCFSGRSTISGFSISSSSSPGEGGSKVKSASLFSHQQMWNNGWIVTTGLYNLAGWMFSKMWNVPSFPPPPPVLRVEINQPRWILLLHAFYINTVDREMSLYLDTIPQSAMSYFGMDKIDWHFCIQRKIYLYC